MAVNYLIARFLKQNFLGFLVSFGLYLGKMIVTQYARNPCINKTYMSSNLQ